MKKVEVKSQAEFDKCVATGNVAVVVGCSVVARDNSSVEATGNSSVVAWDNSSVVARDHVFIRFFSALKITASLSVVILKHVQSDAIEGGRQLDFIDDEKS